MAKILPFRALSFNPKVVGSTLLSKLICPPYDVMSESMRNSYYSADKHNIVRVENPYDNDYMEASKVFNKFRENSVLVKDMIPSIYLYEKEFFINRNKVSVKSIVCRVHIEEFCKGIIIPHERILTKVKEKRFNLLEHTMCQLSPISSIYKGEGISLLNICKNLNTIPVWETVDSFFNVVHRVWRVSDFSTVKEVVSDFKNRKLYIADGHHRYNIALKLKKMYPSVKGTGYVLMELIDTDTEKIMILPTHRIIENYHTFDIEKFLLQCTKYFKVVRLENKSMMKVMLRKNNDKNTIGFIYNEYAYLLKLRDIQIMKKIAPHESDAVNELDVSILHKLIFNYILRINHKEIDLIYKADIDDVKDRKNTKTKSLSFILNPPTLEQIYTVADKRKSMPEKSTYFYPKPPSGLVMYDLTSF